MKFSKTRIRGDTKGGTGFSGHWCNVGNYVLSIQREISGLSILLSNSVKYVSLVLSS